MRKGVLLTAFLLLTAMWATPGNAQMEDLIIEDLIIKVEPQEELIILVEPQEVAYVGLGLSFGPLGLEDKILFVTIDKVICNGPAAKAGLLVGDFVVAINDIQMQGKSDDEFRAVIEMIKAGKEGESVKLTVRREEGDPFDVDVVRAHITPPFDFYCE